MIFDRMVSILIQEGYLKLSQQAMEFINTEFIPKLKETTINHNGVLVFDIVKAAKTKNYNWSAIHDGNLIFGYKLNYVDPKDESKTIQVWLNFINITKSGNGMFTDDQKQIIINASCVPIIGNPKISNYYLEKFKSRSFDEDSLLQLEKLFNQSLRDIDKKHISHMRKTATQKYITSMIEHEFIHAVDPASYQSKDNSQEAFSKQKAKYDKDYYGATGMNSGKIPVEFNTFFWNIINGFEKPLNERTKQFLIDFVKNPEPLIKKLQLFEVDTLGIGDISRYIYGLFKQKDKDYTSFINVLNNRNHRRFLIRIFKDPYLKKKFLQKLYYFIQEN
jgi:hypothetical protein